MRFPQKYSNLVHDLNENAYEAGLGPIAEVYDRHHSNEREYGKDYSDDADFELKNAKNIQEVKDMKEIKSMEEITNIQEIKSMQEVPDDIAEEFIKDEGLTPLDSLNDEEIIDEPVEAAMNLDDVVEEPLPPMEGGREDIKNIDIPFLLFNLWVRCNNLLENYF